MNKYALALAGSLLATAAMAQTTTTQPSGSVPTTAGTTPSTMGTPPATNSATGVPAGTGLVDRNTGTAAASGSRNQAVATTNANAPQPAKGANSFTMGEARRRLERQGYTQVTALKKDQDGVWRGEAMKAGTKSGVWLDYKGNIGQQ